MTVALIQDAIKKLRAVNARSAKGLADLASQPQAVQTSQCCSTPAQEEKNVGSSENVNGRKLALRHLFALNFLCMLHERGGEAKLQVSASGECLASCWSLQLKLPCVSHVRS